MFSPFASNYGANFSGTKLSTLHLKNKMARSYISKANNTKKFPEMNCRKKV